MDQKWDTFNPGDEVIYVADDEHESYDGGAGSGLERGALYIVQHVEHSTPDYGCPICGHGPDGIRVFGYLYRPHHYHCATEFRRPEVDESEELVEHLEKVPENV